MSEQTWIEELDICEDAEALYELGHEIAAVADERLAYIKELHAAIGETHRTPVEEIMRMNEHAADLQKTLNQMEHARIEMQHTIDSQRETVRYLQAENEQLQARWDVLKKKVGDVFSKSRNHAADQCCAFILEQIELLEQAKGGDDALYV